MIKAIIFDCFGVIRADVGVQVYEHFGGDVAKDIEFIKKTYVASDKGQVSSAEVFAKRLGITPEEWRRQVEAGSTLNEELISYILELRKKYKVALLTNIGKGRIFNFFEQDFLDKYFDVVVASGDIGIAKPEPRAYEITAEKLAVRIDECVFFDDRQEFVDGAVAIGMPTFIYSTFEKFKNDLESILD